MTTRRFDILKQRLLPYSDVLRFAVVLILVHFVWKFTITGDEYANEVSVFGCDISAPFVWASVHVAKAVYAILMACGLPIEFVPATTLQFDNGHAACVVWSCTGIKQMVICAAVLLSARGRWLHKAWFVPMSLLVCYLVNIVRISLLTVVIYFAADSFPLLHDYVIKYAFYFVIFMLWVWWNEQFAERK